LSRLVKKGFIRRIRQGLYYYPEQHHLIGELLPAPLNILKALIRAKNAKWVLSGAQAAHHLGLTTQVPMKMIFLTNLTSRIETIGKLSIELKHVSMQKLSGAGHISGTILSALEYLGKEEAQSKKVITHLSSLLKPSDKERLCKNAQVRAAWIRFVVKQIYTSA
jgi:hypothetical protein